MTCHTCMTSRITMMSCARTHVCARTCTSLCTCTAVALLYCCGTVILLWHCYTAVALTCHLTHEMSHLHHTSRHVRIVRAHTLRRSVCIPHPQPLICTPIAGNPYKTPFKWAFCSQVRSQAISEDLRISGCDVMTSDHDDPNATSDILRSEVLLSTPYPLWAK